MLEAKVNGDFFPKAAKREYSRMAGRPEEVWVTGGDPAEDDELSSDIALHPTAEEAITKRSGGKIVRNLFMEFGP